jgi:hypothetical protein
MMLQIIEKWPISWGGHFGGVARYEHHIIGRGYEEIREGYRRFTGVTGGLRKSTLLPHPPRTFCALAGRARAYKG